MDALNASTRNADIPDADKELSLRVISGFFVEYINKIVEVIVRESLTQFTRGKSEEEIKSVLFGFSDGELITTPEGGEQGRCIYVTKRLKNPNYGKEGEIWVTEFGTLWYAGRRYQDEKKRIKTVEESFEIRDRNVGRLASSNNFRLITDAERKTIRQELDKHSGPYLIKKFEDLINKGSSENRIKIKL